MALGEHSHWNKYHSRIVRSFNTKKGPKEVLQLICLDDGEIFHEVEIKEQALKD